MRGYLYQYTKFELMTIIEQYEDYVSSYEEEDRDIDDRLGVERFVAEKWEKELEPKAE